MYTIGYTSCIAFIWQLLSILLAVAALALMNIMQTNICKFALYKLLIDNYSRLKQLYIHKKIIHFSYKGGGSVCVGIVHVSMC